MPRSDMFVSIAQMYVCKIDKDSDYTSDSLEHVM